MPEHRWNVYLGDIDGQQVLVALRPLPLGFAAERDGDIDDAPAVLPSQPPGQAAGDDLVVGMGGKQQADRRVLRHCRQVGQRLRHYPQRATLREQMLEAFHERQIVGMLHCAGPRRHQPMCRPPLTEKSAPVE